MFGSGTQQVTFHQDTAIPHTAVPIAINVSEQKINIEKIF